MRFVLLTLLCAACSRPLLRGDADVRLGDLVTSPALRSASAYAALLADDAEVHRGDSTVRGAAAGSELLTSIVKPPGDTRLMRHHDVSLLSLGEGRVLFMQRNEADRVTRAIELRGPQPGDGVPGWAVEYDHAWNVDDDAPRLALLRATWAEGGRYVDPSNEVIGPEGVSLMIGNFRRVAIGSQVVATTGLVDAGGGWFTWDWVIKSRLGGRVLFIGFDVMHMGPGEKVDFLAGFFDKR